jgi:hypothetical protein
LPSRVGKGKTRHRVEYLTDVALVEANRLKYGVYFNRKGAEEFPEWLMPDYHQAIVDARNLVDDALKAEHDEDWKRESKLILRCCAASDA